MPWRIGLLSISFLLFCCWLPVQAQFSPEFSSLEAQSEEDQPALLRKPIIYLEVLASTWKPRGRISFGIVPLLRTKLNAAGYQVTQDSSTHHDATLTVRYREERGRQISLALHGTDIRCTMTLSYAGDPRTVQFAIHESPEYAGLISAPYIEVMDSFQTNPYFYYLGAVIQGWIGAQQEPLGSLIQALERDLYPVAVREATPFDTLVSPAETFDDLDEHFAPAARNRTIEELGRARDRRALDLLLRLTTHPDRFVRVYALRALEGYDRASTTSAVARAADTDEDGLVRETARSLLEQLP
jgi:hypothetical protein